MDYKINEIAQMASISTRTLRYYDQIGLLTPSNISEAHYRLYSDKDIDLLQQILLYKRLGFPLQTIKRIIHNKEFRFETALEQHKTLLLEEQERIQKIIRTIDYTLEEKKGGNHMENDEKFIGLKEKLLQENDEKYGQEIRAKYGEETIDASYQKMRKMTKWEFQEADRIGKLILSKLQTLYTKDPTSNESMELCKLHQQWIQFYWSTYSEKAHYQLVKMYTEDERFTAYYDKVGNGATQFLFKAMSHYLKRDISS